MKDDESHWAEFTFDDPVVVHGLLFVNERRPSIVRRVGRYLALLLRAWGGDTAIVTVIDHEAGILTLDWRPNRFRRVLRYLATKALDLWAWVYRRTYEAKMDVTLRVYNKQGELVRTELRTMQWEQTGDDAISYFWDPPLELTGDETYDVCYHTDDPALDGVLLWGLGPDT